MNGSILVDGGDFMKTDDPKVMLDRDRFDAVIFDMDGVMTRTARVHAAAWKTLFDEYRERTKGNWRPFDIQEDYLPYVDGKPRYDGIQSFLKSRNITLPYGNKGDGPEKDTVCGLGNRKDTLFQRMLEDKGVDVYDGAVQFVRKLQAAGFKTAIISASKNCASVLRQAGIADLFETRVDGVIAEKLSLAGKPAPDIFLEAAKRLSVAPERTVVVEDAQASVAAGRNGGFGLVIGVNRSGSAEALKRKGAHVVMDDLSRVRVKTSGSDQIPSALEALEQIERETAEKTPAVFLDYDGTLTPIVESPDKAVLTDSMRKTVKLLAKRLKVAVISGRDLEDVRSKVNIDNIFYAGSHGFDIAGPEGRLETSHGGAAYLPELDKAESFLHENLRNVQGLLLERKKFSLAIHYRKVPKEAVPEVEKGVDQAAERFSGLRKSSGKKVYELQPDIDWNKGKALFQVLGALNLKKDNVVPVYIGDDTTDEDAFRAIRDRGIGIVVMEKVRPTAARYLLKDPGEVQDFLEALCSMHAE
jgi:trehalose 6-phosphate phosphatase